MTTGRNSHLTERFAKDPQELAVRKAAFADLKEVELEDCGHMMHHDQPEKLARLIEAFIPVPAAAVARTGG